MLTNRPITSREYKLLLNTERFRDRQAGAGLFWQLLEFLVTNQGNSVIPDADDPDKDAEKTRSTWYLDTPGFELRRADITLRVRDRPSSKKRYKVTLKYRAPDRYSAAERDVDCAQDVDDVSRIAPARSTMEADVRHTCVREVVDTSRVPIQSQRHGRVAAGIDA